MARIHRRSGPADEHSIGNELLKPGRRFQDGDELGIIAGPCRLPPRIGCLACHHKSVSEVITRKVEDPVTGAG